MSRTAWAAIVALGCGHPAGHPTPVTSSRPSSATDAAVPDAPPPALVDDLPRLATRAADLYHQLQHVVESSADCAAATTALNALADSFADVIAANAHILHAGRDKIMQLRTALAPHEADIDASAKAISVAPLLGKCAQDAGFAKAFDRLVGEPS